MTCEEAEADNSKVRALLLEIAEDLPGASESEIYAQFRHELMGGTIPTELLEAIQFEVFMMIYPDVLAELEARGA